MRSTPIGRNRASGALPVSRPLWPPAMASSAPSLTRCSNSCSTKPVPGGAYRRMFEPRPISFDAPLRQRVIELHVWAVRQGLLGTAAAELFDGFCQRLVLGGLPLWRGSGAGRVLLSPRGGG